MTINDNGRTIKIDNIYEAVGGFLVMFKIKNVIRDTVFVFILAFLVRSLASQKGDFYFSYSQDKTQSSPTSQNETQSDDNFSDSIIDYLQILQKQYDKLIEMIESDFGSTEKSPFYKDMTLLERDMESIRQEHQKFVTKTSKTNIFMGPIGAVASVLKESSIKKALKQQALKTNIALAKYLRKKPTAKTENSLDEIIQHTENLLDKV